MKTSDIHNASTKAQVYVKYTVLMVYQIFYLLERLEVMTLDKERNRSSL